MPWHFTRHRKTKPPDLSQPIQKVCTVKFYFSDTLDINGKKEPIWVFSVVKNQPIKIYRFTNDKFHNRQNGKKSVVIVILFVYFLGRFRFKCNGNRFIAISQPICRFRFFGSGISLDRSGQNSSILNMNSKSKQLFNWIFTWLDIVIMILPVFSYTNGFTIVNI